MLFVLLPGLVLARVNEQKTIYNKALAFEKNGEYAKAESLYVDLLSFAPDNYNYYNRYRGILLSQRKYEELLPLVEARQAQRQHDTYSKLELGSIHYALGNLEKAEKIWSDIFKGKKKNIRDAYAVAVYQDAQEYRLASEFYKITDILRDISGDPGLLVKYNFATALQYRNWEKAVEEMIHILNTDVKDLRYVRQYIFRYEPLSALYPRVVHALENMNSSQAIVLLADIYTHLLEYEKAFKVYENNIDEENVRKAMTEFAYSMFDQEEYDLASKTAKTAENNLPVEHKLRQSMALLFARSQEAAFYKKSEQIDIVSYPYESEFLHINFTPFDQELNPLIESAYACYDSLKKLPGPIGQTAAMHHAEISYRVFQDFDGALREYSSLSTAGQIIDKLGLITQISKLMLAKGEYEAALTFIQKATQEYTLMVHEEEQLMALGLYVSLIAGRQDSLNTKTDDVLSMLAPDDPIYNDVLGLAAVLNKVMKDSVNFKSWLTAERYLLMNNTASAIDIYKALLNTDPQAKEIYGLRYLDCLKAQRDNEAEAEFWSHYQTILFNSDQGDYFMLRFAAFMEKMQKFDIAYEIFEKYLLSYQESMYYESIREYVRKHYSLGAP